MPNETESTGSAAHESRRLSTWRLHDCGWTTAHYVLIVFVILLAVFLRTQRLADVGLSFDESFAMKMVDFSWSEMFDRIGQDTHPPLFYVLLKVWQQLFGGSVVAGRLLASVLGLVGVVAMYQFVREAYWRKGATARECFLEAELPAIVAATLLALAPLHLYWTLQIRMYSLATALTLVSSYLLIRALRRERAQDYCWYTLSAVLLAHSHYYGFFVLATQYLYALGYCWFRSRGSVLDRLGPVLISGIALWCAFQPWLPYFLQQRAIVKRGFYLRGPTWEMTGHEMHKLWVGSAQPISVETGLVITQASFIVLLLVLLGRKAGDYYIVAAAALPVAAAYILSSVSDPIIQARYFLLPHVFLLAALAVVACRVPHVGRVIAVVVVIGGMSFVCLAQYRWRENAAELPGMQAAIARFNIARREDEPLVVSNPMLYTSVIVYVRDRRQVYNNLPSGGFPFYHGTPVMREEEYVDAEWLRKTDHEYVWTLNGAGTQVPMTSGWKLIREDYYQAWFDRLTLRLYKRVESP